MSVTSPCEGNVFRIYKINTNNFPFPELPNEVINSICGFLDFPSLFHLGLSVKAFGQYVNPFLKPDVPFYRFKYYLKRVQETATDLKLQSLGKVEADRKFGFCTFRYFAGGEFSVTRWKGRWGHLTVNPNSSPCQFSNTTKAGLSSSISTSEAPQMYARNDKWLIKEQGSKIYVGLRKRKTGSSVSVHFSFQSSGMTKIQLFRDYLLVSTYPADESGLDTLLKRHDLGQVYVVHLPSKQILLDYKLDQRMQKQCPVAPFFIVRGTKMSLGIIFKERPGRVTRFIGALKNAPVVYSFKEVEMPPISLKSTVTADSEEDSLPEEESSLSTSRRALAIEAEESEDDGKDALLDVPFLTNIDPRDNNWKTGATVFLVSAVVVAAIGAGLFSGLYFGGLSPLAAYCVLGGSLGVGFVQLVVSGVCYKRHRALQQNVLITDAV